MVESLKKGIEQINKKMSVKDYDASAICKDIGLLLDHFSESLDQSLPDLPTKNFTRLDKLIKNQRDEEWAALTVEADSMRMDIGVMNLRDIVDQLEDFMYRLRALAVEVSVCVCMFVIVNGYSVGGDDHQIRLKLVCMKPITLAGRIHLYVIFLTA